MVRLQLPQDENVAEAEDEDAETLCRWLANCRVSKPKKKKKENNKKPPRDLGAAAGACPAHSWPPMPQPQPQFETQFQSVSQS